MKDQKNWIHIIKNSVYTISNSAISRSERGGVPLPAPVCCYWSVWPDSLDLVIMVGLWLRSWPVEHIFMLATPVSGFEVKPTWVYSQFFHLELCDIWQINLSGCYFPPEQRGSNSAHPLDLTELLWGSADSSKELDKLVITGIHSHPPWTYLLSETSAEPSSSAGSQGNKNTEQKLQY